MKKLYFWTCLVLVLDLVRAVAVTYLIFPRIELTMTWFDLWGWRDSMRMMIATPVMEEFVYRGFIISTLVVLVNFFVYKREFGVVEWDLPAKIWLPIIIVQASLFGIAHYEVNHNLLQVCNTGTGGALYGLAFMKSRNLLPGILGHSWFNFLVLSLPG